MSDYSPHTLFDLASFAHATLFTKITHSWEALDLLQKYLQTLPLGQHLSSIPAGAFLENTSAISIAKNVTIEPGAFIRGPCHLGEGTTVRHSAYIRGGLITGRDCIIGHATEVKNCILLDGATAAHFAYLGDSILGNRVNLGAGTRLANLRLDRKEVRVGGLSTGRIKLGAIIGDDAQIGCNVVANPGTIIAKGALIRPLVSLGGVCH